MLSLTFYQTATSSKTPILLPENRIRKVRALPQGTDGTTHVGHLTCPDLAAFLQQTQETIQGPSPLPCTMLLPTHNTTLSRKMDISINSLSNVIYRATVCLGNMYFSATHIFWPKETAFGGIGENQAFWVTEMHFVWKETDGICMAAGQARPSSLLFRLVSYL